MIPESASHDDDAADPVRVLVIDDDPDSLLIIEHILNRRPDLRVATAGDAAAGLAMLERAPCDVLVTDVEMPGMSGLELLGQLRAHRPNLPVVVITAHRGVDLVVGALRGQADEFLHKPLEPAELLSTVVRLGRAGRARRVADRRTVLAVGAHPDDVEIGVGGLLCAHHSRGDRIAIITLTGGARGGEMAARRAESEVAAGLVGGRLFMENLDDTRIPVSDPTVSAIQHAIAQVRPDTVYTHSLNDVHQDHRAVHQATLVAARRVPTLACYQSPSATVAFRPNRFAAIDEHMDGKLRLLACFASQANTREYLEPDLIVATARYWSRFGSGRHAEPLEVVRDRSPMAGPSEVTATADAEPEASHAH